MTSSHSFHSLEAEKEPISLTFGHTHTGMIETKSPPPPGVKGHREASAHPSNMLIFTPVHWAGWANRAGSEGSA